MGEPIEAIVVDKWSVGFDHGHGFHVLKCDFMDQQPLILALSPEHAEEIANALLDQVRQKPPTRDRLS